MASSSIIGVSTIFQSPSLQILPRKYPIPPCFSLLAQTLFRKSRNLKCVSSAFATPNSVLSEEAFKGLTGKDFANGSFAEEFDDEGEEDEGEFESEGEGEGEVLSGDELDVAKLGLPQKLIDTLAKRGITKLFPIQRAVLVPALEGRDIIARAKTGTGKTLAFGIPILKRLSEDPEGRGARLSRLPRVLVLAPTRELAKQVEKEMKESAPYLSTVCVYGGVSYTSQQSALSRGVDVVVGTPGRLIDLIKSSSLQLGEVEFLVLDEADQMLAVGFEEDVETILETLPSERQSMLFSATMPTWVKKLARKYLDNPLTIDLGELPLVGNQAPPPCSSHPLTFLPPTSPKLPLLPPTPPPPLPPLHHTTTPYPDPDPDTYPEFESKVLFLDSIGLDSLSLPLLTTTPIHAAFSTSSLDDVKSLFNYLSSFGLHGPDLRRVVSLCPDLLSFRLTDVAPVFTFLLREVNVPLDHLPRVIRRRPRLLACHVDTRLRPTLYFLQSIGIHEVSRYTNLLSSSVEDKFIPKIDYFQKLGFSYRDSISLFRRFPALFCYSIKDNFEPKLNYFVVEMGRDLKELKEFPHYFSFSLEKRIKPRHQSCVENGICLPLPVMLKMKEDLFRQKLDVCCNSSMPRSTSPLWSANNYDVDTM